MDTSNDRLVDDWLAAIDEGREPMVSAANAAKSQEMIAGVITAGLTKERVALPSASRKHPLD